MSGTPFFYKKSCHIPAQDMRSTILRKRQAENDTGQLPASKMHKYRYYGMKVDQQTPKKQKKSAANYIVANRVDSHCHSCVIFLSASTFFAIKSATSQNTKITAIYYFFDTEEPRVLLRVVGGRSTGDLRKREVKNLFSIAGWTTSVQPQCYHEGADRQNHKKSRKEY